MTIRFGIVGFHHGHVEAMLKGARELPGIELVAIADNDPVILSQRAGALQVPAYDDYREMLRMERLDAVGIAAVYSERAAIAADCLRSGLHVTTDKPLCVTTAQVEAVAAAWRQGGGYLHMLLDKRFDPQIWALKQQIDQGALGRVVSVYSTGPHPLRRTHRPAWMFHQETYGGILSDLAIHDLDLVAWLSGSPITSVHGCTGLQRFTEAPEFQDHGDAIARTADGSTGLVHVDWLTPDAAPYWGDYRVYVTGTVGTAEARWYPHPGLTVATCDLPPHEAPLGNHPGAFADFVGAVTGSQAPVVRSEDVLAASAAAVAAQESARIGTWVKPRF